MTEVTAGCVRLLGRKVERALVVVCGEEGGTEAEAQILLRVLQPAPPSGEHVPQPLFTGWMGP